MPEDSLTKDMGTGVVNLGHADSTELVSTVLQARELFWVSGQLPDWKKRDGLSCRYRHGMSPVPVEITSTRDSIEVQFRDPQRGVQRGQVVFAGSERRVCVK